MCIRDRVVVAGAQVVEIDLGIGQQVPGDDQDGTADGHDGLLLPAPSGDAPVTLTKECVGLAGADSGLTQDPGQVAVAVTGGPGALLTSCGLLDAGGEPGPGRKVDRGRETGHVHADLGDDHRGRGGTDTGDLVQASHRISERGKVGLDLGVEVGDVAVEGVDAGEHLGQQEAVVVGEVSDERLLQLGDLGAHPGPCHLSQDLGVAFTGDQGGQHLAAGDPEDVTGHDRQLDLRVLEEFFDAVLLPGLVRYQPDPVPGQIAKPADRNRGDETGPQHLAFGDFTQPDSV